MAKAFSRSQGKIIDVPDTQIPQVSPATDATQTTGQLGQDKFQQAALIDLFTTGGKNLSKIQSLRSISEPSPAQLKIAEEKRKREEKGKPMPELVRALDLLESQFFGEEGEKNLARGQTGLGGRLPGHLALLRSKVSPSESTEDIRTYQRTLESIGAQLAKAGGDVGNIALVEQLLARESLGKVTDTPQEALKAFQATREKFGLPESERLKRAEKRLREAEKEPSSLAKVLGLPASQRTLGEDYANRLVEAGLIAPDEAPQQAKMANAFNAAAMQTQIFTENPIPDLIKGGKDILARIKNIFSAKPAELSPKALNKGLQMASKGNKVRKSAMAKASEEGKKLNGTNLVRHLEKWAKRAKRVYPKNKTRIDDFVNNLKPNLKGKKLNIETGFKMWEDADSGYTSAGKVGKTLNASYFRALRDALRKEIEYAAPGFEKGTKLIREGLKEEEILKTVRTGLKRKEIRTGLESTPSPLLEFFKKTGERMTRGAAYGGGAYALSRFLGMDIPGAFREPR